MTSHQYRARINARLLLSHVKRTRAANDRHPPPEPKRRPSPPT